jgi:hypothetical protein
MDKKLVMVTNSTRSGVLEHPTPRTILLSRSPNPWNMVTIFTFILLPRGHHDGFFVNKEGQDNPRSSWMTSFITKLGSAFGHLSSYKPASSSELLKDMPTFVFLVYVQKAVLPMTAEAWISIPSHCMRGPQPWILRRR